MGYRPRRRHIIGYSRTGGGVGYFRQRKNSIIFLGMFLAGLIFSSLYSVKDGSGGGLILALLHFPDQKKIRVHKLLLSHLKVQNVLCFLLCITAYQLKRIGSF